MDGVNRVHASLIACLCLLMPANAGAAQIVDRNVASPRLRVNAGNVALVTYSAHGVRRRVLSWGAVNWTGGFERDYSGGWSSKKADFRHFADRCRRYTGPPLVLMISACDAPDGSYWALQQWQRLWPSYGGNHAPNELYLSHWRGGIGQLAVTTDYSYEGHISTSGAPSRSTAAPSSVSTGRFTGCRRTRPVATSTSTPASALRGAA
jgi:hypothetical protein